MSDDEKLTTFPVPVPSLATVTVRGTPDQLAVAAIDPAGIVTVVVASELVPDGLTNVHPVNIEPALGLAVNVTSDPWPNVPLHVPVQLVIPAGVLAPVPVGTAVTLPEPVLPPGRT